MLRTLSEEARRRYGPGEFFVLWRAARAETGAESFARVAFRWEEEAAEILERRADRDPAGAEESALEGARPGRGERRRRRPAALERRAGHGGGTTASVARGEDAREGDPARGSRALPRGRAGGPAWRAAARGRSGRRTVAGAAGAGAFRRAEAAPVAVVPAAWEPPAWRGRAASEDGSAAVLEAALRARRRREEAMAEWEATGF
jgi:hypothetical protein